MASSILKAKGTLLLKPDRSSLVRAAAIIKRGGLVAFPTETVYGLGADASCETAVRRIFKAKGRPSDNPLIVHICRFAQLEEVARSLPESVYVLARRFWPGPLSLVLPRADKISPAVSAGLDTVAVRMPDHRVALELIKASGVPIAAPSANRSGRPSPTSYRHVLEDLAGRIDAVIKSERCFIGVESTVLDLTGPEPVILRPGGVAREELEAALNCPVLLSSLKDKMAVPAAPGMKYRHYSPSAPLFLITGPAERRSKMINTLAVYYRRQGLKVGLLNRVIQKFLHCRLEPEHFAAHIYPALRLLDARGTDLILAEEINTTGLGLAVMNRLRKAATRVLRA